MKKIKKKNYHQFIKKIKNKKIEEQTLTTLRKMKQELLLRSH